MSSYLREENQVLREKVEKYESLLEQVMAGPLHEGVICSEYCDNNYRVEIGGHVTFLPYDPRTLCLI